MDVPVPTFVAPPLFRRVVVRLVAAFALLLAMLLGLAAFAVHRNHGSADALAWLTDERLHKVALLERVGREADASARQLLALFIGSSSEAARARADITQAHARLLQAVEAIGDDERDGGRELAFQAVRARLIEYRRAFRETIDRYDAGDIDGARRSLAEDTLDALVQLADAREAMTRLEQQAADNESAALRDRLARDRQVVMLLCIAAITAGGVFSLLVVRGIAVPLRGIEAGARRIADGDYRGRVPVATDDELGRVAAALNTLAEAVHEREMRIHRLVNTDPLTGLAQRPRLFVEGEAVLNEAGARHSGAAMLCFDIDRLKTINAILGFDAGDAVILDAAQRLARVIGPGGRLARVAGGTFAALVPAADIDSARAMALAMKREVEHQVRWEGESLDLSLTTGVAMYPVHGQGVEPLLRQAEQALFEAKRLRIGCAVYAPSLEASRQLQLSLLSALTEAIEGGQLRQFLQPKVAPNGRLVGAEALVRWCHPQRGWLPPGEFVPFAERTGRIGQLTDWMLAEAVRTLAAWRAEGVMLSIAVNISTHDLQDASLPARVRELLAAEGVPPHQLQLELTETGLMETGRDPVAVLEARHATGVGLAIDDFGTGHSSLSYLQRLPMHELKIDRSFVSQAQADPRRREMLRSIVQLGHGLGLKVTGEGVESADELAVLAHAGCDLVQGYHTGRPMDLAAFEAWRAAHDSRVRPGVTSD